MALPAILQIIGGGLYLGNQIRKGRAESRKQANIQQAQQHAYDMSAPLLGAPQQAIVQGMMAEDGEAGMRQLALELNRANMLRNDNARLGMQLGESQRKAILFEQAQDDRQRTLRLQAAEDQRAEDQRNLLKQAQTDQRAARAYQEQYNPDAQYYMAPFLDERGNYRRQAVPVSGREPHTEGRESLQENTALLRNINELYDLVGAVGTQIDPQGLNTGRLRALTAQIQSQIKGDRFLNLGASLFGAEEGFLTRQFDDATSLKNYVLENADVVRQQLTIGQRLVSDRLESDLRETRYWDDLDRERLEGGITLQEAGRRAAEQSRAARQEAELLNQPDASVSVGEYLGNRLDQLSATAGMLGITGDDTAGAGGRLRALQAAGAQMSTGGIPTDLPMAGAAWLMDNPLTALTAAGGGFGLTRLGTRFLSKSGRGQ